MRHVRLTAACLLGSVATHAFADTWTPLTPTTCPDRSDGLFTTGQQYLDPDNGVLQDSWSMLVRWQDPVKTIGPTSWIANAQSYDAGTFTTYTPPGPYSDWQRGYQPESQDDATPGVQLHCFDAGMVLNSWATPHSGYATGATPAERSGIVEGGQFNDMYGYAWSRANQPYAFRQRIAGTWTPSDLVLQGLLAVPALQTFDGTFANGAWSFAPVADPNDFATFSGSGQLDFFAYLRDTSHPALPPIALIAQVYGNGPADAFSCRSLVRKDYPGGVWFGASTLCTTDISTLNYTGGFTTNTLSPELTFYRIHYTPANLANLVNRINEGCTSDCYSADANVYTLEYMGVIAETAPCAHAGAGASLRITCSTNLRDRNQTNYIPNKDGQIGMAVKISRISAYAYTH